MDSETTTKSVIIIGAGPAGLTAAYELLHKTNYNIIVFEKSDSVGGISKTIDYKGNRIDIGPHRFFSKSERVMKWWQNIMPISETITEKNSKEGYENDNVFLTKDRFTRIYYLRKFFNYPISFSIKTIKKLGFLRTIRIVFSYLKTIVLPKRFENSLEDFFINRFGKELYKTFFKDYTEKVWGVKCTEIKPEWGAQRIKGLSISKVIKNAIQTSNGSINNLSQKNAETSLIDRFLYPKLGAGHIWKQVANIVSSKNGKIFLKHEVVGICQKNNIIEYVEVENLSNGEIIKYNADFVFSTMAVKDLIKSFRNKIPDNLRKVANDLQYRDLITIGVLVKRLKIKNDTNIKTRNNIIPDNWVYIQENDVKIGRLQIFNNWSSYMVNDPNTVWLGLEYFCNSNDDLWNKSDEEMKNFAIDELAKINFIEANNVLDSIVIKMEKTYPAYFGSYERFHEIRSFTDTIENLFLIGRNGMHRYNNMDHSMLTAMVAVENIINGKKTKDNIWQVNTEKDYHEEN